MISEYHRQFFLENFSLFTEMFHRQIADPEETYEALNKGVSTLSPQFKAWLAGKYKALAKEVASQDTREKIPYAPLELVYEAPPEKEPFTQPNWRLCGDDTITLIAENMTEVKTGYVSEIDSVDVAFVHEEVLYVKDEMYREALVEAFADKYQIETYHERQMGEEVQI